jgi:hypothetical protein
LAGNDSKNYNMMFLFLHQVGDYSTILFKVNLQITSDSKCNSAYAFYGGITDRMISAGNSNGGRGACWVIGPR